MNFIEQHIEIASTITALIGAIIGYAYRVRTEKRANLKLSLFLLLEVWHKATIITWNSQEKLLHQIFNRINERFPGVNISDDEIKTVQNHFLPILTSNMAKHADGDFDNLKEAYDQVIKLVSKSNPIFAYHLTSASDTKKKLAFIDDYLSESFPITNEEHGNHSHEAVVKEKTLSLVREAVLRDLISDLKKLSLHVGVIEYFQVRNIIKLRQQRLEGPTDEEIDAFINAMPPLSS